MLKKHILFNKERESETGEGKEEGEVKQKNKKDEHKNAKILVVGCGNSRVSEELYDDGYQTIMSIDSCNTLIKQVKDKYKDRNPTLVGTSSCYYGYSHVDGCGRHGLPGQAVRLRSGQGLVRDSPLWGDECQEHPEGGQ